MSAFVAGRSPSYRLLYDLRWMQLGQAGGIEQATYELISAISEIDRRNQFRIFAPRSACHEWDFPAGFHASLHYSDLGGKGAVQLQSFLASRRGREEVRGRSGNAIPLPSGDTGIEFDLVHSLCGYIHPDLLDCQSILTVNDLQHLYYPSFFSAEDWRDRESLYRASVLRARHVICISEFTRQDVHKHYGVPLEKMTTVWIIPSRDVWREISPKLRRSLLARMAITEPFLYFPAHGWPHKNHHRLMEAMALVEKELPRNLLLVLSGRPFPADHPAALAIKDLGIGHRVIHVGYRSPLEARALFQSCEALVFPSLFEGFGMPVAEAMIAGKPVACSNCTALPEVTGGAALTFDPEDVADIANCLLRISTQAELRASLTAAAIRRRAAFSGRRSAVQTLAIYQRLFELAEA